MATSRYRTWNVWLPVLACVALMFRVAGAESTLRLSITDADTKKLIPARVYLQSKDNQWFYFSSDDSAGTAVRYEKQNWINENSTEYYTNVSAHPCSTTVPAGAYTLTVERGPTYFPHTQQIDIGNDTSVSVELQRWFDPTSRGWYSGDTHIHRTIDELRTILPAEDLNVGLPLTNWVTFSDRLPAAGDKSQSDGIPESLIKIDDEHVIWPRNTEYEIFTVGEKRHTLGALFVLGHTGNLQHTVPPWKPVIAAANTSDPPALLDMDKLDWPFAMLLPTLAPNALYELANNHMWRTEFAFKDWNTTAPAFLRPPYGGKAGGHREWIDYTQGMYYTLLNCGFRLPPSAGTANGVHPVPAGFGRVYVHTPSGLDYQTWMNGLAGGRSFVTTGPMLFATANNAISGTRVFRRTATDDPIKLQLEVVSEKPLSYGELIVHGRPQQLLRPQNKKTPAGAFRTVLNVPVQPKRSGWFAVRFWEERPDGQVRFAHTAPWYVEVDGEPVRPRREEQRYLVQRMRDEMARSRDVVSEAAMAEYESALKYYESLPVFNDSNEVAANARTTVGEPQDRWLDNMITAHRFSAEEIRLATGLSMTDAERAVESRLGATFYRETDSPDNVESSAKREIRILPYPGGRHPRRGFLEGAIAPQRETKVSVFTPWKEGGYVVVDVPEAIFSNLGLTYLAHTHIDTIWSRDGVDLPQLEWQASEDALSLSRSLPNGIVFESRVRKEGDAVRMGLALTNGTKQKLTGLRVQVCVMLKAVVGFNVQESLETIVDEPLIAVRGRGTDRWIITAWTPCNRAWENPPVPCIHSDPIFPDCEAGKSVNVQGGLWFYEGPDVREKLKSLKLVASQWNAD